MKRQRFTQFGDSHLIDFSVTCESLGDLQEMVKRVESLRGSTGRICLWSNADPPRRIYDDWAFTIRQQYLTVTPLLPLDNGSTWALCYYLGNVPPTAAELLECVARRLASWIDIFYGEAPKPKPEG